MKVYIILETEFDGVMDRVRITGVYGSLELAESERKIRMIPTPSKPYPDFEIHPWEVLE